MIYSLLLYGPHRYTYIALITFIQLLLHRYLVTAYTAAGKYKAYIVTRKQAVITPYLVAGQQARRHPTSPLYRYVIPVVILIQ